jgi:hypothetical protein
VTVSKNPPLTEEAEAEPVVLLEAKPLPGKPLTTTLNVDLQRQADPKYPRSAHAHARTRVLATVPLSCRRWSLSICAVKAGATER